VQRDRRLAGTRSALDQQDSRQGRANDPVLLAWIVAMMSPMRPVRARPSAASKAPGPPSANPPSTSPSCVADRTSSSGNASSPLASAKYSSSTPVTSLLRIATCRRRERPSDSTPVAR